MKIKNTYSNLIETAGIVLSIWAVVRLLIHVYDYLRFPLALDDGEGHVLNMAILISKGTLPYLPISEPPYIVTNYPPFFPALSSLFLKFSGNINLTPDISVFSGLIVTRLISIIAGFGIVYLIYKCSLRLKVERESAFIVALLFLAMPVVYFWFAIGKPDMFAIFLGLLGLYMAIANLERGKSLYLSLIPFVLAIFTKQNEIAPFAAVVVFLMFRRDRRWLWLLISYFVSIAVITVILQLVTHGEFLKHIIAYTKTEFYLERLIATWKFFAGYFLIPLAITLTVTVTAFIKRNFNPAHLYFIFSLLVSLTSGKVGSDMNYFIESIIAGHIVLGFALGDWFRARETSQNSNGINLRLIASVLVLIVALDYSFVHDKRIFSYTPTRNDYISGSVIINEIKNASGMILSEDEGFAAVSGKEVMLNPFIMSELAKEGIWDQTDFVNMIKEKKFDLIVLRFEITDLNHPDKPMVGGYAGWDRWTVEMEDAIRENYSRYAQIPMRRMWFLYHPID